VGVVGDQLQISSRVLIVMEVIIIHHPQMKRYVLLCVCVCVCGIIALYIFLVFMPVNDSRKVKKSAREHKSQSVLYGGFVFFLKNSYEK